LATEEKGKVLVDAAIENLAGLILELKERAIEPRVDHH